MLKHILILFSLLVSLSVLCGDLPQTVTQGLVIEVHVKKHTFGVGEIIKVDVVMRNDSNLPFLVVGNFGKEIADPTPEGWNGNPASLPRDMLWDNIFLYASPFGSRYRQDHDFPATLLSFENLTLKRDSSLDESGFYYRNLMCLLPGMEVGCIFKYKVEKLPDGLSEGNYEIQYRYEMRKDIAERQIHYLKNIKGATRLNPVPMHLSGDDLEFSYSPLPYFQGIVWSDLLKLKVIKEDSNE